MENLGLRLKQERKRLGLSQQSFGKIGGVEPNAQGKYESGERSPRADYLQKITAAGVDTQYVLNGIASGLGGQQSNPAVRASSLKLPDNGNHEPTADIISLLTQLSQNLHLTAQAIAEVVEIVAPTGSLEHRTELANRLRTFHADSDRLVEVAISRADVSHING